MPTAGRSRWWRRWKITPQMAPDDGVHESVSDSGRHHLAECPCTRGAHTITMIPAQRKHQFLSKHMMKPGSFLVSFQERLAGHFPSEPRQNARDHASYVRWDERRHLT